MAKTGQGFTMNGNDEHARAREARRIAMVLGGTIVAWVAINAVGRALALPNALALVVDFAALAAFAWALVMTYRIWRARQDN